MYKIMSIQKTASEGQEQGMLGGTRFYNPAKEI